MGFKASKGAITLLNDKRDRPYHLSSTLSDMSSGSPGHRGYAAGQTLAMVVILLLCLPLLPLALLFVTFVRLRDRLARVERGGSTRAVVPHRP
jgi:hypothetical protein